jgi:hypothetical protein
MLPKTLTRLDALTEAVNVSDARRFTKLCAHLMTHAYSVKDANQLEYRAVVRQGAIAGIFMRTKQYADIAGMQNTMTADDWTYLGFDSAEQVIQFLESVGVTKMKRQRRPAPYRSSPYD